MTRCVCHGSCEDVSDQIEVADLCTGLLCVVVAACDELTGSKTSFHIKHQTLKDTLIDAFFLNDMSNGALNEVCNVNFTDDI